MESKEIYILLTDTGTLFTKMIRLYTKKPYNHASIALDENLTNVYSFGRKTMRNPFIGGFVKEDLNTQLFKHAQGAIYCCQVNYEQLKKIKVQLRKMELEKEKYKYNLMGLIALTIKKEINRKYAFFCSEFVATILQECEVVQFEKPLSQITPSDLVENTGFELIYDGPIEEWNKELPSTPISL